MINFKEFQEWTRTKAQKGMTPYDFATNMGLGLVEASEVIGEYKKIIFHRHPVDINKLTEELGDFNYYYSEIANIWGIDLQAMWEVSKLYETLNMQGVESRLTDKENKIIDGLTNLNKSAADLLAAIRDRSLIYDPWSREVTVKALIYSIIESKKTILHLQGIKIEDVLQGNVEKLNKRFPDGFSSADSIARVDTNG